MNLFPKTKDQRLTVRIGIECHVLYRIWYAGITPLHQLKHGPLLSLRGKVVTENESSRSVRKQRSRNADICRIADLCGGVEITPDVETTDLARKGQDARWATANSCAASNLGRGAHDCQTSCATDAVEKHPIEVIPQAQLFHDQEIESWVAGIGASYADGMRDVAVISSPFF
jgi:hypothetical protein